MTLVCGVDGCPAGWVAVWHDLGLDKMRWHVVARLEDLVDIDTLPACIAVDVPIGLLERGARECDREARRLLGFPRSASVFPAPLRPVLAAKSHGEASSIRRAIEGKGMSVQAWGIVPKVHEVDDALHANARLRTVAREVHPELSFTRMCHGQPMAFGKKCASGRAERIDALRRAFGKRVDQALGSRPAGCGVDDLLDAFACVWTAARVASAVAQMIPDVPPHDSTGLSMEMLF